MITLNKNEISKIKGGTCYYAGLAYSTGAEIKNSNGDSQTCQADGTWSQGE